MSLSLDENRLLQLIKRAALAAVAASDPMSLRIGDVISTSPLTVRINQKLTVSGKQLLTTAAVRKYDSYANPFGRDLALSVGERVMLLRADGGQTYIVLDRLEESG